VYTHPMRAAMHIDTQR